MAASKQSKHFMRRSIGETGGQNPPPPLKNHKNIGFLSNTVPDPLKFSNSQSQHLMLGHHRHASAAPLKWRFSGGSIMPHL